VRSMIDRVLTPGSERVGVGGDAVRRFGGCVLGPLRFPATKNWAVGGNCRWLRGSAANVITPVFPACS
jgi:hypothetical protein